MDDFIFNLLNVLPTLGLAVVIFLSLYVLGKAADYLVNQAIVLSAIWGVPEVIVGATIISLGTTIPEATVSIVAALEGSADLALGNAIGSIITNGTLILGMSALIANIPIDRNLMKKQGGVLLGSTMLLGFTALPFIYGDGDGVGKVTRSMGVVFLVILGVYIYQSIKEGRSGASAGDQKVQDRSIVYQITRILIGTIFVIISSKILIPSVQITATRIGIPESVIAATLVAFGTSVPELMTSITAVRKGHGELAVGNVIGANILNILFVVGSGAVVSANGLIFPELYLKLQIPIMIIVTAGLFSMGMDKKGEINKKNGIVLIGIYIAYVILSYLL